MTATSDPLILTFSSILKLTFVTMFPKNTTKQTVLGSKLPLSYDFFIFVTLMVQPVERSLVLLGVNIFSLIISANPLRDFIYSASKG